MVPAAAPHQIYHPPFAAAFGLELGNCGAALPALRHVIVKEYLYMMPAETFPIAGVLALIGAAAAPGNEQITLHFNDCLMPDAIAALGGPVDERNTGAINERVGEDERGEEMDESDERRLPGWLPRLAALPPQLLRRVRFKRIFGERTEVGAEALRLAGASSSGAASLGGGGGGGRCGGQLGLHF